MTCPACRSENDMVFSVLSHGVLCQEEGCGLELELETQEMETLLHPEEELVYA